jgi:hypothetical protein
MSVRVLRCPACDAAMNEVERQGISIDVCQGCKGVFLDRGELDKLIATAAAAEQSPLAAEADRLSRRHGDEDEDDERRGPGGRGRRRRGFLDDLFDFG